MCEPVKIGPWGGAGGQLHYMAHTPSKLVSVEVFTGSEAIHALGFTYILDISGNLQEEKWGGSDGTKHEFVLQDSEYVKEFSGTYGPGYNVSALVTSLKFVTNLGNTYEYSTAGSGTSFGVPLVDDQIVAFFVRAGDVIDAIGIYVLAA